MPEQGVIDDVRFYSHTASGHVRLAIYDGSLKSQLLWQSPNIANLSANSWITVPVSSSSPPALNLSAGTYFLAWQTDSDDPVPSYFGEGSWGSGWYLPYNYGLFPSEIDEASQTKNTQNWSGYLTYHVPLSCTYALLPSSRIVGADGGNAFAVNVEPSSEECSWTAMSSAPWLTVTSGAAGTGTGTVTYSVGANTGTTRTATLTVGSAQHTVVQTAAFHQWWDETLDEAPGPGRWLPFAMTVPALADQTYDAPAGGLLGRVWANASRYRAAGWVSGQPLWLPYSSVGTENYVRGKFYVFASLPAGDWQTTGAMPHVRMRLSHRYAQNAMLEVFNHVNADPGASNNYGHEIRPSTNPATPSLYRVDFSPVATPFLLDSGTTEGIWAGFEAYTMEPQDEGYVGLAELELGVYPRSLVPDTVAPVKVYAPSGSDAGDLRLVTPSDLGKLLFDISGPIDVGEIPPVDSNPGTPQPQHLEGPWGITLSSVGVPANRLAIVTREFDAGPYAQRVRVEEGKLYKVRFHVTSTRASNLQSQMRLRARSVRWLWSQKLEIGGAQNAGAASNLDAQQALPGVGCLNPDREPGEATGGWYTLLIQSPLRAEIRPEYALGTPVSDRMPNLSGQPGPGVDAPSLRDLRVGFDLMDTLSGGALRDLEEGEFTLDRIEIRAYDDIDDGGL